MRKNKVLTMTEGSILKILIAYAIPLLGSSLFQQLYNTADFLFVGNVLGKSSAAAVGASSTLINCTVGLFTGISVGVNVVVAQAIGAKNYEKANKALHSSVTFGMIGGLLLMILGVICAPAILTLLDTPENILEEAISYIRIYLISIPMLIFYNMCAGALRACGDSRTPFYILVICGIVNVLADAFFLLIIPMGVVGVAIATSVSQGLSALLAILALRHDRRAVKLSMQNLRISWYVMRDVLSVGLPSGIQSIIFTFSNMMVQYYINGFGDIAIAAFATYYKSENIIYLPIMAFGQAATTFSGQNAGARQFRRLRRGTLITAFGGSIVTFCTAGLILLAPHVVFGWFMKDQEVIACAVRIARVSFPFYWIYPIMEVLGGAVRGMGYSIRSMFVIVINMCIIRVSLLSLFSKQFHTLEAIASVYPITWITAVISFIAIFFSLVNQRIKKYNMHQRF